MEDYKWIAQENIARYRKLLDGSDNEGEKSVLTELLRIELDKYPDLSFKVKMK
jgi:hypothetical protein